MDGRGCGKMLMIDSRGSSKEGLERAHVNCLAIDQNYDQSRLAFCRLSVIDIARLGALFGSTNTCRHIHDTRSEKRNIACVEATQNVITIDETSSNSYFSFLILHYASHSFSNHIQIGSFVLLALGSWLKTFRYKKIWFEDEGRAALIELHSRLRSLGIPAWQFKH